jgi:signal transduction histidine kinase
MLSQIAGQQLDPKHPSFNHIKRITEDAKNLGASMDDIVWSINPDNDLITNIIARINRNTAELFEAKGLEFEINTGNIDPTVKLKMEQRRDIYLIYKEAINNLLKYAECQKAIVSIETTPNFLEIKIQDNGKGFDTKNSHLGNGLKNMKKRAQDLKAVLSIDSEIGKGTRLHLKVPL